MGNYAGTVIGPDGKRYPIGTVFPPHLDSETYRTYGTPADGQVGVWVAENRRVEWGGQDGQSLLAIEAALLSLTASLDEIKPVLSTLAALNGLPGQVDDIEDFLGLVSAAATLDATPPRLVTGSATG
jgi:hypothetical protein